MLRIYDAEGKLFDEIKLSSSSLRSNPSMHHSRYYINGGSGEEEREKTQRSRSEEKVVGFSSASLFPVRKWEAATQGETIEPR